MASLETPYREIMVEPSEDRKPAFQTLQLSFLQGSIYQKSVTFCLKNFLIPFLFD